MSNEHIKHRKILKIILPLIGVIIFAHLLNDIGVNKVAITFSKISQAVIVLVMLLILPKLLLNSYSWN